MLVHIGYHKCGSTWLQRNLFNLTNCGFCPICPDPKHRKAEAKYLSEFFVYHRSGYIL